MNRESGYAAVSGGRLFYRIAGSGEAVVLVHGNAGDHRHWDAQVDALAAHYRVLVYDVRGYGRSSTPVEGDPYADHEDLAALLDHLGIEQAHVVGWSMGSAIVVDFALAFPGRTRSLVAVGPWVSGYASPAADAMFAEMGAIGAALERGPEAAVDAWMSAPFFAETIVDREAGERFRTIASDYSFWAFSHQSPQRPLKPAAGRTSQIGVPTLIMTAEKDIPGCVEVADLLHETVEGSRKVVMTGAGHLLHMERPAEFNEQLLDFLRLVPQR